MKRFLGGFIIVLSIILIYFLIAYYCGDSINFIDLFLFPIIIYFMITLCAKINGKLFSEKYSFILKVVSICFFGICTLLEIFKDTNISNAFTLIVLVAIIFNWTEKKGSKNEKMDCSAKRENNFFYYLIPFVVLLFVYVIVAMLFYRYTNIEENKLKLIFLYGGILVLEYWGVYLFYRYFLRKNKAAKIFKIIFLFAFSFGIYTFAKSITQYSTTSLLLVDLSAVVSVTAIDLLFSNHKITEKMETEECKDD